MPLLNVKDRKKKNTFFNSIDEVREFDSKFMFSNKIYSNSQILNCGWRNSKLFPLQLRPVI